MILSELLGAPVVEGGRRVGRIADLRFLLDEEISDGDLASRRTPEARLYGLVVSPRSPGSFLGYERLGVSRPRLLAWLLRRRERDSFLVLWHDIGQLSGDGAVLRPGARRWSAALVDSVTRRSRQGQN